MAKTKIIVLKGNKERTANLTTILERVGKYDSSASDNPRQLMDPMDGKGEVKLVITNPTIARLLARRCPPRPKTSQRIAFRGTIFAADLLHDIDKVLMTEYFAEEIAEDASYGMLRAAGAPPEVVEALFRKNGISKEDFDKWAPEIRDDIAVTFATLGGA